MRTRKRKLAAVIFLLAMSVNFLAEGYLLFGVYGHGVDLVTEFVRKNLAGATPVAQSKSCCSKPPQKKSCGCAHCGDSCPMGDACTCSADGHGRSHGDGLFFRAPSCHPGDAATGQSYLPLSMRLVYLPAQAIATPVSKAITGTFLPADVTRGRLLDSPPVPPPRPVAA